MIHLPEEGARTTCIVGLDPGSESLGIAAIEFDIETMTIVKTTAKTLVGSKLMRKDTWAIELHGERPSRVEALHNAILDELIDKSPVQIACESPFFSSRMPSAFGVLMEVLIAVRSAVLQYDRWRIVYLIDPPTVKRGVGGKGNADKFKMKELVLALPDLCFTGPVALADLDEHSIDAIAVAYTRFKELQT